MPCGRHRASFDQVSEFDRGRIVADKDCGLSLRETVNVLDETKKLMWICHRWMQEKTTGPITPTLLHHYP
ncbi:hypothetical protein TNCV_3896241 [Trichonephila clavipes]|nr:hypothetical protein TNCV_3896241 [Trichonephila clavipes]